jgi:outer membrane beta-barrel protein
MRNMILFAALVWSVSAVALEANSPLPADAPIAQSGAKGTTPADDDEEDPTPGAKPPEAPKKTEEKKDAPAMGAVSTTPAPSNAQAQKLVSGAPLYNPNVAVHIVEQKAYSDKGRHEIVLFGAAQINGKFTQHVGVGGAYVFHLQENFGFQISGYYNAFAEESAFNTELIQKVRAEAQAATSLLNTWGALAGVEVTPIYGKFALFQNNLAHFSIVLSGGVGLGGTRHQLKPPTEARAATATMAAVDASPATYGDTGLRFLGGLGGGFRLQLGKHVAFRLEVRDVVYTARVDAINGCSTGDLRAMDQATRNGMKPSTANVSASCNVSTFEGVDPKTGRNRSEDVPLANNLVKAPISSDVLNNLGLYIGVSALF